MLPIKPSSIPFTVEYVDARRKQELLADNQTLALIGFDESARGPAGDACEFTLALPQLEGTRQLEYWKAASPVTHEQIDGIHVARTPDVLFAYLEQPADDMRHDARAAYARLYRLLEKTGYPHLLRVWNYFPRLLETDGAEQRYRAFCVGRHETLAPLAIPPQSLPAASALGSLAGPFQFYFLAAKSPGIQIENPRQVSAFNYPPRYSPRSPAFSRALFKHWPESEHLYISGTASIVGHESRHREPLPQLEETLSNIEALISTAHHRHALPISHFAQLDLIKIYLSHPQWLPQVKSALQSRFPGSKPARLFLQGTVCREDLLLEIEGMYLGRAKDSG